MEAENIGANTDSMDRRRDRERERRKKPRRRSSRLRIRLNSETGERTRHRSHSEPAAVRRRSSVSDLSKKKVKKKVLRNKDSKHLLVDQMTDAENSGLSLKADSKVSEAKSTDLPYPTNVPGYQSKKLSGKML